MNEIKAINVQISCNLECDSCERFYDCNAPEKESFKEKGRMQLAREAMGRIKYKILVLGGKGGVGKTMTAVNLAAVLAMKGRKVTVLDQNFDGPAVPRMLGIEGKKLSIGERGLVPVDASLDIQVVSMGLILEENEVLTWFHDMKRNALEEFSCHVEYGDRDYLVIDVPAGTSSETVNVLKYIPDLDGAVVVTVPSMVSQNVAKKAVLLCLKANIKVFGIVENMSGFTCPDCNERVDIIQRGGGEMLAEELKVPFLGKIPLDPMVADSSDEGKPFVISYPDREASKAMVSIAESVEESLGYS